MRWLLLMFVVGDLEPVGTFPTKAECVEAGKASEGWVERKAGEWAQGLRPGFICVPKPSG